MALINFPIWVPKPCKTAKFFNQLNVFAMSPVFVTAPFLVQKALKTANSAKCVFSCPASKVVPGPPNSLVFLRKLAAGVRRAPKSDSPLGRCHHGSPGRRPCRQGGRKRAGLPALQLEVLLEPTLTTLGNFRAFGGSIPGLVQQSAGTLDLYSMQIRALAFEESRSP